MPDVKEDKRLQILGTTD